MYRLLWLAPLLLIGCTRFQQENALLARLQDADALAVAALIRLDPETNSGERQDSALKLMARATEQAPDRPDLAWLHVGLCARVSSCDSEPLETRFRAIEPRNAVGWINALARAQDAKRDADVEQYLAAIGRAQSMDLYWMVLANKLTHARANVTSEPFEDAIVPVIDRLGSLALPPIEVILSLCKDEQLERAGRLTSCRGAAAALQQGDTYLAEIVGVAIAMRVWPASSQEARAAAEARRVYRYRMSIVDEVDKQSISSPQTAKASLALRAQYRTEQEYYAARIVQAGRSPTPPEDWAEREDSAQ